MYLRKISRIKIDKIKMACLNLAELIIIEMKDNRYEW